MWLIDSFFVLLCKDFTSSHRYKTIQIQNRIKNYFQQSQCENLGRLPSKAGWIDAEMIEQKSVVVEDDIDESAVVEASTVAVENVEAAAVASFVVAVK